MHPNLTHRDRTLKLPRWAAPLLALLLVAVSLLHLRTLNTPVQFWNLSYTYAASQCLVDGCNPYEAAALNRNAARRGWPLDVPATPDSAQYPPSTLLFAVPLGALSWPHAELVYNALSLLLLWAAFTLLLVDAAAARAGWISLGLLVAAIAGRPFLQGLEAGNLTVPAAASLALACSLLLGRYHRAASACGALFLLLALILKPQLAIGALVLLLVQRDTRRWAAAALIAFLVELLAGCTAFALQLGSFAYLNSLIHLTRFAVSHGQMLDPSPANPVAYTFLQLQALLLEFPAIHVAAANALTLLLVATLAAATCWITHRNRLLPRRRYTLLALAALLTLLPVYHRQYDRTLVLLMIPAAIELAHQALLWRVAFTAGVAAWMTWDPILERLPHRDPAIAWSVLLELALCLLLLANLLRNSQPEGFRNSQPEAPDLIAS